MTSRGALAYAHARIRAARGRLLTRVQAAPLFTAENTTAMQRAVAALGVENPFRRLVHVYETAMRGYPGGRPLLRALLMRHEMENVKLLWRITAMRLSRSSLPRLWLDLGSLAKVPAAGDAAGPRELAVRLAGTPFGAIAATVARAHASDLPGAELALDRWMTERLREEAQRLPRRERYARRLVELVAAERDAELVRRGVKWYGLTRVSGEGGDVATMRHERLRLCHRALIGSPFLLGPAIAVVLLAEEEARALQGLAERLGDPSLDDALLRVLAASELGA